MIVAIATFRHNIDLLDNIVPKLLPPLHAPLSFHSGACVCVFYTYLLHFCFNSIDSFFKAREKETMPKHWVSARSEMASFPSCTSVLQESRPDVVCLSLYDDNTHRGLRAVCQPSPHHHTATLKFR